METNRTLETTQHANDGFAGLGRKERRRMVRRWQCEGAGQSLKAWARQALVGDAAAAWLASKRAG
jgi:hypothetical protein